jgi:hypothetical protein
LSYFNETKPHGNFQENQVRFGAPQGFVMAGFLHNKRPTGKGSKKGGSSGIDCLMRPAVVAECLPPIRFGCA